MIYKDDLNFFDNVLILAKLVEFPQILHTPNLPLSYKIKIKIVNHVKFIVQPYIFFI